MFPLIRAWVSTSALYLSGVLLPVGGVFLMLFTPQPGLRLERSAGRPALVLLIALVAATVALVGGPLAAALYLAGFASLTLVLPVVVRRSGSIEGTVGSTSVILAGVLAAVVFGFFASPAEVQEGYEEILADSRGGMLELVRQSDVGDRQVEELSAVSENLVHLAARIGPALVLVGLGFTVLLNLVVVRVSQRRAGGVPIFGDLTRWRAPGMLVWAFVAGGYGLFLPEGLAQTLGLNLFVIATAIYFAQGLAIVQFWFTRWGSPPWLRGLFWVIVLVEWLFAAGVVLLGVFDLWADFRRLDPRPDDDDDE